MRATVILNGSASSGTIGGGACLGPGSRSTAAVPLDADLIVGAAIGNLFQRLQQRRGFPAARSPLGNPYVPVFCGARGLRAAGGFLLFTEDAGGV